MMKTRRAVAIGAAETLDWCWTSPYEASPCWSVPAPGLSSAFRLGVDTASRIKGATNPRPAARVARRRNSRRPFRDWRRRPRDRLLPLGDCWPFMLTPLSRRKFELLRMLYIVDLVKLKHRKLRCILRGHGSIRKRSHKSKAAEQVLVLRARFNLDSGRGWIHFS